MNRFQLMGLSVHDLRQLKADVNYAISQKTLELYGQSRLARWQRKRLKKRIAASYTLSSRHPAVVENNNVGRKAVCGRNKIHAAALEPMFPSLIQQDWSDVYPCAGGDRKFYVYAHVDPSKAAFCSSAANGGNWGGMPFYIGKGTGARAFDLKRNQGHGKRLAALVTAGVPEEIIVKIVWDGLTEQEAFALEAKCIYFFGTVYELGKAGKRGMLLNLDVPKIPVFEGVMSIPGIIAPKEG